MAFDPTTIVDAPEASGGFDPSTIAPDTPKSSNPLRVLADIPVGLASGFAGLINAGVGLGDVATGGAVSRGVDALGEVADKVGIPAAARPTQWQSEIQDLYSPETKGAKEAAHQVSVDAVEQAKADGSGALGQELAGFTGAVKGTVQNPLAAMSFLTENWGGMKAIAKGTEVALAKSLPGIEKAVASGVMTQAQADAKIASMAGVIAPAGEGILTVGQNAQQLHAEKPNATAGDYLLQIPAGIITGAIAHGVNRIPGLGDAETTMALNALGKKSNSTGSLTARAAKGFLSEGVLQEGIQSPQEQFWQNLAEDKPWYEGMGEQSAQGIMSGGPLGAGASVMSGLAEQRQADDRAKNPLTTIAGLLPAPVYPGMESADIVKANVDRQNAVDAAQANADSVYAARDAYEAAMKTAFPYGMPKVTTPIAPIQEAINNYMGIDQERLTPKQRLAYESDVKALLAEPVGVTNDKNGLEIPLTMGDLLESQATVEKAVRRLSVEQAKAKAKADKENPIVAPAPPVEEAKPAIPVVGPLSAAASVAVQTGVTEAMKPEPVVQAPEPTVYQTGSEEKAGSFGDGGTGKVAVKHDAQGGFSVTASWDKGTEKKSTGSSFPVGHDVNQAIAQITQKHGGFTAQTETEQAKAETKATKTETPVKQDDIGAMFDDVMSEEKANTPASTAEPKVADSNRIANELSINGYDVQSAMDSGYGEAQIRALLANSESKAKAEELLKQLGSSFSPAMQGYKPWKVAKSEAEQIINGVKNTPPAEARLPVPETSQVSEASPVAAEHNAEVYKPMLERLIRNKRNAKELGFDIDGAIAKAKKAMAGEKQMPGSFRKLANQAEKRGDKETADVLRQIADLNDARKTPKNEKPESAPGESAPNPTQGEKHESPSEVLTPNSGAVNNEPAPESTNKPIANGTAPEHVETGVDDRELGQIVKEFNNAQQRMIQDDEKMTHIFDAPEKKDIVRLEDKTRVYQKEHGWMTVSEAKDRIAEWKDHAEAQGETRDNSQKIVLSLFDLTGKWSEPWEAAGYQVYRFDIQDDPEMGDVNNFSTEFFSDWFGDFEGQDIYAILAATPCTDFASSGAKHFAAKDEDGRTIASVKLVHQTLATIEYFKPAVWALENPVGRIERLGGLPPWRLSFNPNHLGDPYTKKTLLWGRFDADLPIAPVEPTEGSKMFSQYGGKSQATKNARSVTPEGFAYGFFMANNAIDHPEMAIANKYDRLDPAIIAKAVKAGMTEEDIGSLVDDFYYMDLDDAAANQAILDAINEGPDGLDGQKTSIDEAAHEAATSPNNDLPQPTEAQKKAGNYTMGHIPPELIHGLDVTIENPQGSVRSGVDADGKPWSNTLANHYGYIKGTVGHDGDHVDAFIGENPESTAVFIVDQRNTKTKEFDEHKVLLGFNTLEEAKAGYSASYQKGWMPKGVIAVTPTTIEGLKAWLDTGDMHKPFARQEEKNKSSGDTAEQQVAKFKEELKTAKLVGDSPLEKFENWAKVSGVWDLGPWHAGIVRKFYLEKVAEKSDRPPMTRIETDYKQAARKETNYESFVRFADQAKEEGLKNLEFALRDAARMGVSPGYGEKIISKMNSLFVAARANSEKQFRIWKAKGLTERQSRDMYGSDKADAPKPKPLPERVAEAKKEATVSDAVTRGVYVVQGSDGSSNLATFTIGRNAKPINVKYFYEASETRGEADKAIAKFMADRAATSEALWGPRELDEKGNPIYKKGERVEYTSGRYEGRHGVIESVLASESTSYMMFSGETPRKEVSYHYEVLTDNGAQFYASPSEIVPEKDKPENVVMDPVVDGRSVEPLILHNSIGYAKKSAADYRASAQRARKASVIAEYKRNAELQDLKASKAQADWTAWAKQNPEEAEKVAPTKQATPTKDQRENAETGAPVAAQADILKAAGIVVTKGTTNNGKEVWNVSGNTKEHSADIKSAGGRWYGPKKVWSFYNDDPSVAIAEKLGGKVTAAAPESAPVLGDNDVMLPGNPYVYRKEGDKWTWRVGVSSERGNPLGNDGPLIPTLNAAWSEKNPSIDLVPVIDIPDAELEGVLLDKDTTPKEKEAASNELDARDAANLPDIGAMFDDIMAEETKPAVDPYQTVLFKAGSFMTIDGEGYRIRNDYSQGNKNDGDAVSLRTDGMVARVVDKPFAEVEAAITANKEKIRKMPTPQIEAPVPTSKNVSQPNEEAIGLEGLQKILDGMLERQAKEGPIGDDRLASNIAKLQKTIADETPRTATQAAGSAVVNTAKGVGDVFDALGALFGSKGSRLSMGLSFDENTYEQAKPLFISAISHFKDAAADLREAIRAVIREMNQRFGDEVTANMKPYIVQFFEDVRAGKIVYDESSTVKDADNDTAPAGPENTLDNPLVEGQPGNDDASHRGATPPSDDAGRPNDRGLEQQGPGLDASANEVESVGDGRGVEGIHNGPDGVVAGNVQRVSADFRPGIGGLTRTGSWFDSAKRNVDLIDLAIKIDKEGRNATPEEQALLAKYVGFGAGEIRNPLFPIPGSYDKSQQPDRLIWPDYVRDARWKELAVRIEAMPREWQESILQSTQYAHYTSEGIIRSVWSAIQRLGFTGGKIFEPGTGIGSFAMLMPKSIHDTSTYVGVEFDAPTALIARLLSPDQKIQHGDFIKRKFPKNFFDVNIGNPPFSKTPILGDPEYAKKSFMLHDFFFAKGIDLVRPGGIQAFVTSKGTMDKQTDKARKFLSDRADLIGAIRLPSTAFEGNAGTSVVTDVIFLRKRGPGEAPGGEAWANLKSVDTKDGPVLINEYFSNHPEMVLGQNRISGNTDDMGRRINSNGRGGERYTVVSYDSAPEDLDAKFAEAVKNFPENIYSPLGQTDTSVKEEIKKVDYDPSIKREGVIYMGKDGTIMRVTGGVGVPLEGSTKLSDKDKVWIKGYIGLRDGVHEARLAQVNEADWEASLKKLNKSYAAFVKAHGNILEFTTTTRKKTDEEGTVIETESRRFKNHRLYREDYDAALVLSLEAINEAGEIIKAPFLLGRTIGKPVVVEIKSAGDALAVSLDTIGKLDIDDIARQMHLDREEVIDALGAQIYKTPTGEWQLSDEYLSGEVVAKLEEVEHAVLHDESLRRNVEALKAVQPEKLGPSQISAKLGASWIGEAHANEFAREIGAGQVSFHEKTETWQVEGGNLRSGRSAGDEYGTAKRSPSEILEAVLNSRSITIKHDSYAAPELKGKTDEAATTAANEAAKKVKEKFKGWVWTDNDRAADLVESYNKRFNNIAGRSFDGSHLTLPGVSLRFKLHPHQLRTIWRQIQTGSTYLAHAVGAGKTIEMIAGGMEQKRLGLIKKPMYVVPNHMLEQFSNEFMELYPLANIMVADDENFSAERRKAFIAAATLNSPDAIVITHSAFKRIGVTEESVAPIRNEILADLEIELSDTASGNETRVRRSQLEQQIEAVKQRFDAIINASGRDSTIRFEDIGVDFIYADEAHAFRKLDFHTAQQIKGIDPNGSQAAMDMYVKTRILEKSRPGRSFVFASGTPVTNTMGELYTIMRFFAQEELDKGGISTFDAWARQFGEVRGALEPNAAGRYEVVERFSKFDNVPELMSRVRQFMDVLTSDSLGSLVKRPDIKGGKPNLNIVPSNPALKTYMETVLARRIEISKAWKPSPGEKGNPDPIVAIITDGRLAAIDPRFFGGSTKESTLITEMADSVAKTYHATKNNVYYDKSGKAEPIKGSTQLVFFNLGYGAQVQARSGFNSRAALTKRMTDGGIPRDQIAWFSDANSDAKKEAIFKAMRSGKLKVLIGSAKQMGTGVNVQNRLIELHYQDPPWFPSDVEQPHGRILRQGNLNPEISIQWYSTKGTYQSTMWQMVARKQRFIDQAFTGDKNMRSMEDVGEASLFEQAAAVASGDPRAIQLAGLHQDVERFERLQAAHASEQISISSGLKHETWYAESNRKAVARLSAAYKAIGESHYTFTSGKVKGVEYLKVGEFGQAIKDRFNAVAKEQEGHYSDAAISIGSMNNGVEVLMAPHFERDKRTGDFELSIEVGGLNIFVTRGSLFGEDVDAIGLGRRIINPVNQIQVNLSDKQRALVENETNIKKLTKKRGAPFEYQQEMIDKHNELIALEAELRAEGSAPAVAPAIGMEPGLYRVTPPEGEGSVQEVELNAEQIADHLANKWKIEPIDALTVYPAKAERMPPLDGLLGNAASDGRISSADKAVYGMVAEGKSAQEILKFIAAASRNPFYKQLAKLLLKTGIAPTMTATDAKGWKFNAGNDNKYSAAYNPATDTVALFRPAASERNALHEFMHAATLAAMAKNGLAAQQMRKLFNHVKSTGKLKGMYGMANVDEFIAEAFSNPKFQQALKKVNAPSSAGGLADAWSWFVRVVRGILGLSQNDHSALAAALEIGVGVMRENMSLEVTGSYGDLPGNLRGTSGELPGKVHYNLTEQASNQLHDLFHTNNTFNWLHKSVTTQYHKATLNTGFKKVFDIGQEFLLDTSRFAMDAADLAPHLLQKLGSLSDVFRKGAKAKDVEAIAGPVFNGTLSNVVYSDSQLRNDYNLSDDQISLYREFRAGVNKSLDDLGISEMARIAKSILPPEIISQAKASNLDDAMDLLHDALLKDSAQKVDDAKIARADGNDEKAKSLESEALLSEKTADDVKAKAGRIGQLKGQGYAPLMRFGQFMVDVVEEGPIPGESERIYFGMYETQREANQAARAFKLEYPDATVSQGPMDTESWKLFSGVDPSSLEVFADAVGADTSEVFQDYLRLTLNNRSALKRMIKREGIAGFSKDTQRVLAQFVTSNARLSAKNYHFGDMKKAVMDIPKGQGDVRNEAAKLVDYLQNPNEEAAPLRGYLFMHFLGGSIASALTNMTQPITMTMPYLAQFGGATKAGAAMSKAAMLYKSGKYDPDLAKALKLADREGITAPHEIHQLYAESMRGLGRNIIVRKGLRVWGSFFSLAESFNRHLTFVAAFNLARDNGHGNPFAFAQTAVEETQGVYNKGNRPDWARGTIGATVFTFKQFSIAYVEFLSRLYKNDKKAFALAMAIMFVGAGAEGWPFAEDIEDVIDTVGQFAGYTTNSKQWLRKTARDVFGELGGELFRKGVSAIPGMPIDISSRIGVQNLIPGTAMFKVSEKDKTKDIFEFIGPLGGFAQSAVKGFDAARTGDISGAVRLAAPLALQNVAKAADMLHYGFYRDQQGRKVVDTTVGDALAKGIGFQPNVVAKESAKIRELQQTINQQRVIESEIADNWAAGVFDHDPQKVAEAQSTLREWNLKNPDAKISIAPIQISTRLKAMNSTREQRFIKSTPKEMRGAIMKELHQ